MTTGWRSAVLVTLMLISGSGVSTGAVADSTTAEPTVTKQTVLEKKPVEQAKDLFWDALAPAPDQDVLLKYHDGKISREDALKYLEELGKTPVLDVNKTYVRVPGYLVPLNLHEKQKATEFLLVPTMGSCIHVPPPPPNQTVFIKYDKGIEVEEAGYTAYWVTGTIKVERSESEYTETLYTMDVKKIEIYEFE